MADIGDKLRKARQEKGMSIEDVERITKIQRRYLTAIEKNDFEQLPGDFYVRAFIKQYAQVVGLDGKELLNDYHQDVPESKPEEYVENSIDNKSQEVKRTTNNKKGLWKAYLPKAAAVIGVFLVIFVVYLVYVNFFAGPNNQQSANQAENVTVSSSSESSSSKKSHKKATAKHKIKLKKLSDDTYRVLDWSKAKDRKLKLSTGSNSTWAQVSVDGSVMWQGTLAEHSSHSVKLSKNVKNVVVIFGNSTSSKLTLSGVKVDARATTNPAAGITINFVFGKEANTASSSQTTSQNNYNYSSGSSSTSQNYNSNQTQSSQTNSNQGQTTQNQQVQNNQTTQTQNSGQTVQNNGGQQENTENNQGQTNGGQ